jgi:hypothetical protein
LFFRYTYSKIQSANKGMKKLRNDVRNKKETLQKLIENYENGILPRINFVVIIFLGVNILFSKYSFILHSKI